MIIHHPNSDQVWRTVPLKLLPVNEMKYTKEWAEKTYSYRYLFDESTTKETYNNDNELEDWRLQALQIMKEIKNIGIAYGRNEIVNLSRGHYGMTMPHACDCKPTNIDDVMSIIENEEWYNHEKVYKQNIIYHLLYGLTRSGMNGWILEQEQKWLRKHRILYNQDDVGIRKSKLRGFVYCIMNSKFSNSTIKLFRTAMLRKYGEFITVRQPSYHSPANFIYTPRTFIGGRGYVVTCTRTKEQLEHTQNDTVETMGSKWLSMCLADTMSIYEIHNMVDELHNNIKTESNESSTAKTTFSDVTDPLLDKVNKISNKCACDVTRARKEPRLQLDRWRQNVSVGLNGMYFFVSLDKPIYVYVYNLTNVYCYKLR